MTRAGPEGRARTAARGETMQETEGGDRGGAGTPPRTPEQPRLVNLAAVAGAVVLVGLVAFALYRKSHPAAPPPATAPAGGAGAGGTGKGAAGRTPNSPPPPGRPAPQATLTP